mmetsp:Transcript_38467/g.115193  ORF Transcript_38467/g.115193 Transcript_38467/m.115193 type:complete len:241 (-) Transcript_38467:8-730(-)
MLRLLSDSVELRAQRSELWANSSRGMSFEPTRHRVRAQPLQHRADGHGARMERQRLLPLLCRSEVPQLLLHRQMQVEIAPMARLVRVARRAARAQLLHDAKVAAHAGRKQGAAAHPAGVERIDVGARAEELVNGVQAAARCRRHQRQAALGVLGVGICARAELHRHRPGVRRPAGPHEPHLPLSPLRPPTSGGDRAAGRREQRGAGEVLERGGAHFAGRGGSLSPLPRVLAAGRRARYTS